MEAGSLIREARSRSGLARRKLARLAGTSAATLSAYEAGRSIPSTKTLERILLASGFKLEMAIVPDDSLEERRLAETLESVLDLADAFPRNTPGPLTYPVLAGVVSR